MKKNDAMVVVRLPKELKSKLEKIAETFEISLSAALRMLLEKNMNQ